SHWAVYPLLIGIAFVVRALKIKKGMILGLFFILGSLIVIFSIKLPEWFNWVYQFTNYLESYCPIVLIVVGVYLLMKKKYELIIKRNFIQVGVPQYLEVWYLLPWI